MPRRRRTAGSAGCRRSAFRRRRQRRNGPLRRTPESSVIRFGSGVLPNQTVRTWPISPEGASFKPVRCQKHRNSLISRQSDIRTKTGVVRLCQRKGAYRDARRARNGLPGRCSWFGRMAANARVLCGSGRRRAQEKECPDGGDWRRERSATRNILHFRGHPSGGCCKGRDLSAGRGSPAGPYGA
jgi:hypothetical protein